MALIDEAISAMIAEVEPIAKARKNKDQGFMFRGIDQVYEAVSPLLSKYKVYPTAKILNTDRFERDTRNGGKLFVVCLRIEYTFHAADGSIVTTEAIGEGADSGDKAGSKAMSIAYKYALFQMLCIPTEALVDPDAESHDIVGSQPASDPAPRAQGTSNPPCPECGKPGYRSKKQGEKEFYCWRKKNGCGHQWHSGDQAEPPQTGTGSSKPKAAAPPAGQESGKDAVSKKAEIIAYVRNMTAVTDAGKTRKRVVAFEADGILTADDTIEIEKAIVARLNELANQP